MRFILVTLEKDLRQRLRDPWSVVLWAGIPFGILLLFSLAFGSGGNVKPQAHLLLVDEDETLVSGLVAGAFNQGELADLVNVEAVGRDEGMERIHDGDGSALLVIPEGFGEAVLKDRPTTLKLWTNPAQRILPGIIQDVTEILLDLGFYAEQLLGDEISLIMDSDFEGAPGDLFVADISVRIQDKIEAIEPKVFPPVIDVDIVEPPPAEPGLDIALLFLPGIVLMAVLFTANSLASDYWIERDTGTLRRLVSAPGQLGAFVAGKALAAASIIGGIALVTLLVGFAYHDVAWTKLLSSLLWVTLGGVGLFAWFAALQMLFPNQKGASLVTTILLFPLLMAGGSFFPLAVLPGWIQAIGRISPNGFIADRLTGELTSAAAWSFDANSWLVVLVMTASGLAICSWRLRTGFARR